MTDVTAPKEPFHLIVDVPEEGLSEPTVGVRWCIEPETKQWLLDNKIEDPFLLICVSNVFNEEYTEMDRYVVPLTQMMEFVRLRRAGVNVLSATIVWKTPKDETQSSTRQSDKSPNWIMKHVLLERSSSGFITDLIGRYNGGEMFRGPFKRQKAHTSFDYHIVSRHDHLTTTVFPNIPAEAFGKASPAWEKLYFAKWSGKPTDECKRRKRRMVTYPLFPVFAVWTSFLKTLLATGATIGGVRNVRLLQPLRHPLIYGIDDTWSESVGQGNGWADLFRKVPKWAYLILPTSVVIISFLEILNLQGLRNTVIIFGGTAVLAAAFILVVRFFGSTLDRIEQRIYRRDAAAYQKDLDRLACDRAPTEVALSSLPKNRRTVHLRFQNVKRKVCKPFQG